MKYLEQAIKMVKLWQEIDPDPAVLPYAIAAFAEHASKLDRKESIIDYHEHAVRLVWLCRMSHWTDDVLVEAIANLVEKSVREDRDGTTAALRDTTSDAGTTTPLFLVGYHTYTPEGD